MLVEPATRLVQDAGTMLVWDPRLEFWIRQSLRDVALRGKSVLDVGAGQGAFTCYMAHQGARVMALEPDLDGSGEGKGLAALARQVDQRGLTSVRYTADTFQSFESAERFDLVLLQAVINHLDEAAVSVAHRDAAARDRYRALLGKVYRLLAPGGTVIIADAARDNLYAWLGLQNPFAPKIEWHKHQNPALWSGLLREVGFEGIEVNWAIPNRLRPVGWLCNNWPAAFVLHSHFVLHATRPQEPAVVRVA